MSPLARLLLSVPVAVLVGVVTLRALVRGTR
jgi:hypothetical protein